MAQVNECEGYKIIDRLRIGEVEIVLGHSLTAPEPYVTWKAYEHSDYKDFVMGHYHGTLENARTDFIDRAKDALDYYTPAKKKTQEKEKSAPGKVR